MPIAVLPRGSRPELDHEAIWPPVLVLAAALVALMPRLGLALPPCPLLTVTGIPCPSCGGSRALGALLRLDLAAALAWNPLVAAGAMAAAVFVLYCLAVRLAGAPRLRLVQLSVAERIGATLLLLGNWVYVVVRLG